MHVEAPVRNWALYIPVVLCLISWLRKAWGEKNKGTWGTKVIHAEGIEEWCKKQS